MAFVLFRLWFRAGKVLLAVAAMLLMIVAASAHAQKLLLPSAEAYDAAGNLFFVDTNLNQVFEVSLSGTVTVVAGNGTQGFSGDNAAAVDAELNAPQGIAVGVDGTVYIADTGNQRIRSVAGGMITTTAGTGGRGFSGDNAVAATAMFDTPTALALDLQGALLLCDTGNQRIRRIANGVISTIAGNGTQGFSGDGGAAIAAELDSPAGIAVAPDGRVLIADTHNQRIRAIAANGTINTIAGTGSTGFSGDGASALAARLSLPRGLAIGAAGNILIADSNNQRLRSINAQGIITTIAGSGVQGFSQDGMAATTAVLNVPRAIAASSSGAIGFVDTANKLVREVAVNGEVFTVAPAPVTRASSITLNAPASTIYGQGSATVLLESNAAQPQGIVSLLDGGTSIGNARLANGSAVIPLSGLSAGAHQLTAAFAGDGLSPAAASANVAVEVLPATITVSVNSATIAYGQPIPALTGTSSGVLPQDASRVAVSFGTSAVAMSPVGSYPIVASLNGAASANYSLKVSTESLQIVQARSGVTLQPVAAQSYSGLPLLLTANVISMTSGVPTGEVDFVDGSNVVAKATVVNGVASAAYASPPNGAQSLSAVYVGDTNFLGGSSSTVTTSIEPMPDFGIAASSMSETVQGGLIASYPLTVSTVGGAFTGSVTFSVSGLPTGATVSFSPAVVVPGAAGAAVTMNVQTAALAQLAPLRSAPISWALFLPIGIFSLRWRKRGSLLWGFFALSVFLMATIGCGSRTVSSGSLESQSSRLTVIATSTNLAGTAVSHSTLVTLTIQ